MAKELRYKIQKQGANKSSDPHEEWEWEDYNGAVTGFTKNSDLSRPQVREWMKAFRESTDGQANEAWGRDPDRTGSKPCRLNVVYDRTVIT